MPVLAGPAILRGAAIAILLSAGVPVGAAADTVRLRADYWCPYNCDPGDEDPGYMIEIAERAAARLGLEIDYELMPWDRTMSEVRAGSVDAAVGATALEGDGLVLSDPLGYDADCFFVAAGNQWRFEGVDSLPKVLLGAVSGYTHDEGPVDAYIAANSQPNGSVITSAGDEASSRNIRLLLLGRIDALIDSEAVIRMEAERQGQLGQIQIAGCLEALPLHIAFSPKFGSAAALVAALREEVASLRKSGRLAEILGRYGLVDWRR